MRICTIAMVAALAALTPFSAFAACASRPPPLPIGMLFYHGTNLQKFAVGATPAGELTLEVPDGKAWFAGETDRDLAIHVGIERTIMRRGTRVFLHTFKTTKMFSLLECDNRFDLAAKLELQPPGNREDLTAYDATISSAVCAEAKQKGVETALKTGVAVGYKLRSPIRPVQRPEYMLCFPDKVLAPVSDSRLIPAGNPQPLDFRDVGSQVFEARDAIGRYQYNSTQQQFRFRPQQQ